MEIANRQSTPCAMTRYRNSLRMAGDARRAFKQILWKVGLPPLSSKATPFYEGDHIVDPSQPAVKAAICPAPYIERLKGILSQVKARSPLADASLVEEAFSLAWRGHNGRLRKDGENPYFEHPLSVAEIVAGWGLGPEEIAAALCHDMIEDGRIASERVTEDFLKKELGERVGQLVQGVTELGKESKNKSEKPPLVEIYMKWLKYGSKDLASIIIKLADRLHNMRTLAYTKPETREGKAKETLNVYSRITDRLGMWDLKREFEDLSFQYLEAEVFQRIEKKREEIVGLSEGKTERIVQTLHECLDDSKLVKEIVVEKRFIYELHQRMQKRKLSLENLSPSDIWRINIVVPDESSCFDVLGRVHKLYRPDQSEIRDYINDPRTNGHQFLHTYLRAQGFGLVLLQIRDQKMQMNYRRGVLSQLGEKKSRAWIVALLEDLKRDQALPEGDFYGMLASFTEPITVFTERGKEVKLPFGSTPLDFARRIHTEIFLHAAGVKINDQPAELFQPLQDGDRVQVGTDEAAHPSIEWLAHVRTPKARRALQKYLGKRKAGEILADAILALDRESKKYFLPARELIKTALFVKHYSSLGFTEPDPFLTEIGMGKRRAEEVVSGLREFYRIELKKYREAKWWEPEPYYLAITTKDRKGLIDSLIHPLRELGFNLCDVFPVDFKGDGEKIQIVLGVDVFGGRLGGGMAGQIQRLQVNTIARQVLAGEGENIIFLQGEKVIELLKRKVENLRRGKS